MATKAKVTFGWSPSVSADALSQTLMVSVAGSLVINRPLPVDAHEYTATDEELFSPEDVLDISVTTFDAEGLQATATASHQLHRPEAPAPVTDLAVTKVEWVDVADAPVAPAAPTA